MVSHDNKRKMMILIQKIFLKELRPENPDFLGLCKELTQVSEKE
jgi:hypothetical protein